MLAIDLELVEAHRREACAPEPPELDLKQDLPELRQLSASNPRTSAASGSTSRATSAPARPFSAVASAPIKAPVRPLVSNAAIKAPSTMARRLTPTEPSKPPPQALLKLSGALRSEPDELRMFAARWKIDLTRAKMAVASVPPAQRQRVFREFKPKSSLPLKEFEEFVKVLRAQAAPRAAQPQTANGGAIRRLPPAATTIKRPSSFAGPTGPRTPPMTPPYGSMRPKSPQRPPPRFASQSAPPARLQIGRPTAPAIGKSAVSARPSTAAPYSSVAAPRVALMYPSVTHRVAAIPKAATVSGSLKRPLSSIAASVDPAAKRSRPLGATPVAAAGIRRPLEGPSSTPRNGTAPSAKATARAAPFSAFSSATTSRPGNLIDSLLLKGK